MKNEIKVVITGGPGGGKTTALDLFRRELSGKVNIVPESATLLFAGGIKRSTNKNALKETQRTIYNLQKNLESLQMTICPENVLVCDRGTLDGLAYWPGTNEEFFKTINSSFDAELNRYDAVIFFETAASNGQSIDSNNPYRNESQQAAVELDKQLQAIWSKHPSYHFIASSESFMDKIVKGVKTIQTVIDSHKNK